MRDGAIEPPVSIQLARCALRKPMIADAIEMFRCYSSDVEVSKYLTWKPHSDLNETLAFLERSLELWESGNNLNFVVNEKENGKIVGMASVRFDHHIAAIGIALGRSYWGFKLGEEIVRGLVNWCLVRQEVFRIECVVDCSHAASERMLISAGFMFEGVLRRRSVHPNISSEPRDCKIYSITR